MKQYNLINNLLGWLSFAIAAIVYLLTIEPTASFWDCGEFITSAYKLEVGHPPGAPFFMLTGNFFTLFASDPSKVAMMVNAMSALMSALTILFLFWTITHLVKKLVYTDSSKEMTLGQLIVIMGSGLVGALTYTFTDTFWFSAVEGEVYAYSSMFTALVFWLILKWENVADRPKSDKWLILIAYVMGLSIGVHLLNLLCIPAIVLIYYYKKIEKPTWKGMLWALLVSFGLIIVLMYGVIPGITKVGGWFEIFFVNTLGLSYNSGALFYVVLIIGLIAWSLYETISSKGSLKRAKIGFLLCVSLAGVTFISSSVIIWLILFGGIAAGLFMSSRVTMQMLNTSLLCLLVILIGYSSYALIPIRSSANTPMDQNSPEDVFSLRDYLGREQYGDTPLFYGTTYASETKRDAQRNPAVSDTKERYDKIVKNSPNDPDKYFVAGTSSSYETTNNMLFPRMHASKDSPGWDRYVDGYQKWGGVKDPNIAPTFMQNLQFLFNYQLNFMYWRYFMWNFSGRQNDIPSTGGINNGNWLTGVGFIDELRGLGPQDNLPPDIADNKGHNVYYMIPFILGIIGIVFQLTRGAKGERQFWVVFMLFFMTGIAIVLYLNQKPYEPRERDYAYAGSFYAYCIWIGFGVAGLWALLKRVLSETPSAIVVSVVVLLVPIQMASQNWDDHDRSDRYTTRDFGMNYLTTCPPNAILFCNGDNDTFPLWYAQEVEGYRTDVRVCNLSYSQTDWYLDQMKRQSYESEPMPISWEKKNYIGDKNGYTYIFTKGDIINYLSAMEKEQSGGLFAPSMNFAEYYDANAYKDTLDLYEIMSKMRQDQYYVPKNPFRNAEQLRASVIPGNKLMIQFDSTKIDWTQLGTKPVDKMLWNLENKQAIAPHELMVMELISNISKDNWKRPIYYGATVGSEMHINLDRQMMLEGIAYRVVPGKLPESQVNTDVMFDNMVNKYKWGNINNPKVYLDENVTRLSYSFRYMFIQLVSALIEEGKTEKAKIALDKSMTEIPHYAVPMGSESTSMANFYYLLGEPKKGEEVLNNVIDRADRTIQWYNRLKPTQMRLCVKEIATAFDALNRAADVYALNGQTDKSDKMIDSYFQFAELYYRNGSTNLGNHVTGQLIESAIRRYHTFNGNQAKQDAESKKIDKASKMMGSYSPEALKELHNKFYRQ